MTLTLWLSLVAVCSLGAIAPGPSLAVVLRHSINNGRSHGILTAISHALGVAIWALLTILGLALLVTAQPLLYQLITYSGAAYLAWMGLKALGSKGSPRLRIATIRAPLAEAARDGLLISLLNPKLALFFIALFSQFVATDLNRTDQSIMLATATLIDALWYSIVAILLTRPEMIDKLQAHSATIDKITGLVLLGLALRVVTL